MFESRKNSYFTFLCGHINSRKILVQITKWSTSIKITYCQNGGKSSWRSFSYVGSKFKYLQLIYRWKGNFVKINIVLRTRVQISTYFKLYIENRRDIFLKVVNFLLKIVNTRRSYLQNQISLQLVISV